MTTLLLIVLIFALFWWQSVYIHTLFYMLERRTFEKDTSLVRVNSQVYTYAPTDSGAQRMLILGDCMALSFGVDHNEKRLHRLVEAAWGDRITVAVYGNIGATTHTLLRERAQWAQDADIVWLFVGPNDLKRGRWFSFNWTLNRLFKAVREKTGATKIIWTVGSPAVLPAVPRLFRPFFSFAASVILTHSKLIARKHGVTILSIMSASNTDPFVKSPAEYFALDQFHPSEKGYEHIFEMCNEKVLKPFLARDLHGAE